MKLSRKVVAFILFLFYSTSHFCSAQDYDTEAQATLPKGLDNCNGIFLSYNFLSRTKEYPHVKNATAQAWAFNSTVTIFNTGTNVLQAWKIFIGFQYREILVSASGATLTGGEDFPSPVGNGTYLSGYPQTDLESSIDTAGDLNQISAQVELSGTQFGLRPPRIPMPKTIKLVKDGYRCPPPLLRQTSMYVCCVRNPKYKAKELKTKFLPRQKGDLLISYDVIQAFGNNYIAEVTIENSNPLGRLDHWNLTWEWMRGEFIYSMKGAYVREVDYASCIYGLAGQYYKEMDFSQVLNCQKKPIIFDLPAERANDTQLGKIPYCCRNGTILPKTMDASKSKSVFQVQVFKIPPDLNRTAIYPPQRWKIVGVLNPDYKCGHPIRVDPTQFPDPSGLQATKHAIASWQVVCNISRPKEGKFKCCVSFSAYYNQSVIPCNTCACGCENTGKCNPHKQAMLLPGEAILLPFANRSTKARAWASIHHFPIPKQLPCGDNCGVSINWHVTSDYADGWAARITLFNWEEFNFENWFTAIQLKKAGSGYEKVYSFNGTLLKQLNNTIFMQGLPGLTYLMAEVNGSNPRTDPKVPGKQQSVISFKKKLSQGIDIAKGDGFPSRVFFNGEECALPTRIPIGNGGNSYSVNFFLIVFILAIAGFLLIEIHS